MPRGVFLCGQTRFDRIVQQSVGLVPPAGTPMQGSHLGFAQVLPGGLAHGLGEKRVISIPGMASIIAERNQKEIGTLELRQEQGAVGPPGDRIAQ